MLPSCTVELVAMAERDPRVAARAVPGEGRARVLVPEGGDGAPRHAVRARAEGARLRASTRTTCSRRRTRTGARSSSGTATTIEVFEGPSPEELAAAHGENVWETNPDLYLAIAKIGPLVRALGDLDAWITGVRRDQSPTRANAPKLGWDEQHELWKANPLADWSDERLLGVHPRTRPAVQPAARPGLRVDRRHALDAARRRARGPLGGDRQGRVRHPHGRDGRREGAPHLTGLVVWFTGLSGAGQVDDRANVVEAELEQRGLRRRPPRRRRRAHAPLEGPRLLEGGPRRRTSQRIGWVASRLARAGAAVDRLRDLAVRGDAAHAFARSSSSTRRSSRCYVATPLEECARRDPKGLYAKAFAGEIPEFTGVSRPVRGAGEPGGPPRHRGA